MTLYPLPPKNILSLPFVDFFLVLSSQVCEIDSLVVSILPALIFNADCVFFQDEDLVDDTLEDVDDDDLDTESGLTALPADAPPPPVEFDFNDGFDDGYNDGDGGGDLEGSSIF